MRKLVESETRYKDVEHENIIRILGHGWLPEPHSYFYIDMELYDSNLYEYIYGTRTVQDAAESLDDEPNPAYIPRECSFLVKLRNIWTIMTHISDGLKFIHTYRRVHRGLKPCNGKSRLERMMLTL